MVMNSIDIPEVEKSRFSDLGVLRSAAGYYIGTTFCDASGDELPGSRDSTYFGTKESALKFLTDIEAMDEREAAMLLRKYP